MVDVSRFGCAVGFTRQVVDPQVVRNLFQSKTAQPRAFALTGVIATCQRSAVVEDVDAKFLLWVINLRGCQRRESHNVLVLRVSRNKNVDGRQQRGVVGQGCRPTVKWPEIDEQLHEVNDERVHLGHEED